MRQRLAQLLFDVGCVFVARAARLAPRALGWSAGVELDESALRWGLTLRFGRGEVFRPAEGTWLS